MPPTSHLATLLHERGMRLELMRFVEFLRLATQRLLFALLMTTLFCFFL